MTEVRKGAAPNSRAAAAEYDLTGRMLEGHASVFDYEYQISGERAHTFTEVVRRGAFRRSLALSPPVVQWLHGKDTLGQIPIAELIRASEDKTGLYYKARLFDAPQLDLLRQALEAGAVSGASFRFAVDPGGERWSKADTYRELTSLRVLELGPVLWAASPAATVKLRGPDPDVVAARRRMDARLRAAGKPALYSTVSTKPISRAELARRAAAVLAASPPRKIPTSRR